VGNRASARHHLRRAAQLAPLYPGNRLNLIEAYLKWGERGEAAREYRNLQQIWPEAQKNLTGEAWTMSWINWERRNAEARKRLVEPTRTIESPRSSQ
jgi:DNA-binding SARP family transcriptional activator